MQCLLGNPSDSGDPLLCEELPAQVQSFPQRSEEFQVEPGRRVNETAGLGAVKIDDMDSA